MGSYRINYDLSKKELFRSFVVSEYGLRHLKASKQDSRVKWGHRLIAVIELCPVIGLFATAIEGIIVKLRQQTKQPWLFQGSQENATGKVELEKAKAIARGIHQTAAKSISFPADKVQSYLEGGTCTAMSFSFLKKYLKRKNELLRTGQLTPEKLQEEVKKMRRKFTSASQKLRNRQSAFNTIQVDASIPKVDFSWSKMQSLAKFNKWTITPASEEVNIERPESKLSMKKLINDLPQGVYIVRLIKPKANDKLEEHGHTMIFINEPNLSCFYDPNYGARNLANEDKGELLKASLLEVSNCFDIKLLRFYRVLPAQQV